MPLTTVDRKKIAWKLSNESRAIAAHEGLITFVVGKVRKEGLVNVLQKKKYAWLKSMYLRVIGFAEDVQIKRIPQKMESEREVLIINRAEKLENLRRQILPVALEN